MNSDSIDSGFAAPADAIPRAPWPIWKRVVAYIALLALAVTSVWFIDRKVRHLPDRDRMTSGAEQMPATIK